MRADLLTLYKDHIERSKTSTVEALSRSGFDSVTIHSGSLIKRSMFDDQYWPLRPVPHFEHWAHLPWPDCAIHVSEAKGARLLYIRDRSFWERPKEPDWDALGAALQLVEVDSLEQLKQEISHSGRSAFIGENAAVAGTLGFDHASMNPPSLLSELDEIRVFKTPYEQACIHEANQIAAKGHEAVRKAFEGGERSELKLHLLYLDATQQDDAETPYKNIVAVGKAAAILHHVHYERIASASESSLLLDAGATFSGYASDITRTYAGGKSTTEVNKFAELIAGMEKLQQGLCASVRVGRKYEDLHDESHKLMSELLIDSGIVSGMTPESCVKTGITRKFFPHGLGHSLGLQCHDVGCAKVKPRDDNPFLRNTRIIEPDQVFTIEPGIYFIDTFLEELQTGAQASHIDWKTVEVLKPFGGIRIEDDVLVADKEVKNMTREAIGD